MPKKPTEKTVQDAIAALDTVRRDWLRRRGVTAVDVGFKISDEQLTDTVALRVHVTRKLPIAELAPADVFNDAAKPTPKKVAGFPVDVIEANYAPAVGAPSTVLDPEDTAAIAALERTTEFDPMVGGISVGNPRITAGTIGAIVYDRTTGDPMILSNWHVLAGASAAAVGEPIRQPGAIDGGTETVATLTRMRLDSTMDAAVATLNGARPSSRDILGLGTVSGTELPTLGMNVIKSGRTTGVTRGVVDGVSMSVSIDYTDPGVVAFSGMIRIVPRPPWPGTDYEVSRGGDSGSVWLNEANNRAIGLHFAGENDPAPAAENAICCPIGPVSTALDFSFFPVLKPWKPPIRFDIRSICERFPWICKGVLVEPPFELPPFPDPRWNRPMDLGDLRGLGDLGGLGGLLGAGDLRRIAGLIQQQQSTPNCAGCGDRGGAGGDSVALLQLAALVAAMLEADDR